LTTQAVTLPATSAFSRKELFIWLVAILFATSLSQTVLQVSAYSAGENLFIRPTGIGAFQLLGWFAVFRLLARDSPDVPASGWNFAVTGLLGGTNIALGMIDMMPVQRGIWIVATLAAIYIYLTNAKGSYSRAGATVLFALCVQSLWGPVFFSLFALNFLHADAAIVGTLLDATRSGYTWHGNVIATQGHSIEIYSPCSSFHNMSLAALCWVTLTKLSRPNWIPTDFIFGATAVAAMVVLNVSRLYVEALNHAAWDYWHNGTGVHIFQVGASVTILLISLWGSSKRDMRHE